MSDKKDGPDPKLGAGSLQAMGRLGFHELRNAMYPGSNVAAPGEAGMYGSALPSEVAEQRQGELQPGDPPATSVIDSRIKEADRQVQFSQDDRARDPRNLERE